MVKEDMFAHKLVALLDRKQIANRDLFDVWFFMKQGWDFNEEIIKLRTGTEPVEYLQKCLQELGEIKKRHLLQGMGELLDPRQKSWVKENLLSDLSFLCRFYIEKLSK